MLQKSAHDSAPLWPADYSSFPGYVMTRLLGSWRETSVMADCLFITSGLPTRHPVPPHRGQGTEDRSSTCGGLVGMSASWGHASEFVDIPARFTLCPNLNCVAVIFNFFHHQAFAIILLSSFSSDLHMLKNLILFIVLVSFNSPGYDAIQGNLWPTSCMQTWSVFIR